MQFCDNDLHNLINKDSCFEDGVDWILTNIMLSFTNCKAFATNLNGYHGLPLWKQDVFSVICTFNLRPVTREGGGVSLQYSEKNFRKRKAEKMKLQKSQFFRLRGH